MQPALACTQLSTTGLNTAQRPDLRPLVCGLLFSATALQPGLAAPFCKDSDAAFQDPTPPVERVNGVNVQRCSSGMGCINQMYAAMTRQQPKPAASYLRPQGKRVCLEAIPIPGQANTSGAEASAAAASPDSGPATITTPPVNEQGQ